MSHDPFKLCSDVTCPHCGVKGRLVSEQETRYFDDEHDDFELLTCVECGGLHESHGFSGDEHLKAIRIQYGRLIEGRPYDPPKPKEVAKPSATTVALNEMYKQFYGVKIIADASIPSDMVLMTSHPWTTLGDWMDRATKLGEDE